MKNVFLIGIAYLISLAASAQTGKIVGKINDHNGMELLLELQ